MDILSKLPFLADETEIDTEEVDEVQAKKDRIAFHRAHVRNGPATFKTLTSGQVKRAQRRALKGRTRKARRSQIQNYFATQQLAASVRGHLQAAGVLPYVHERPIDPHKQVVSAAWLVQRFGVNVTVENEEGDLVETGEVSFAYFDVLTALGDALKFYGQSIGREDLQVLEGYVVPIFEQGTEPAGVRA